MKVQKALANLPEEMHGKCHYRQVDMRDLLQVKGVLLDINSIYGGIKNIFHASTPPASLSLDAALRHMVSGSWNLHIASQELKLTLDSFVLLSSAE